MQNKMNKDKSTEVLKAFGNPVIKTPTTNLVFARQSQEDVNQIEKMSDDELTEHWKSLNWMNYIYGQVSLNELQRISLLELEMDNRPNINQEELANWYKKAEQEQELQELELNTVNYSAPETMVTNTKEDEALLAWQDLKNECELNGLENQSNEG